MYLNSIRLSLSFLKCCYPVLSLYSYHPIPFKFRHSVKQQPISPKFHFYIFFFFLLNKLCYFKS
jgi:hypothetical protein